MPNRIRRTAQLVKCLLYKYKDPSLSSGSYGKGRHSGTHLCLRGGVEIQGSLGLPVLAVCPK